MFMIKIQWGVFKLFARTLARSLRAVFSLSAQMGIFVFVILLTAAQLSDLTAAPLFPAMGDVVADAIPIEPGHLTRPVMAPLVDAIIATLISLSTLLLYKVSTVVKNHVEKKSDPKPDSTLRRERPDSDEPPSTQDGPSERPYSGDR